MIVLDFEWNRGYDRTNLNEILQIGAVRMEGLAGPVTDIFNVYIRPRVHKKFDPGAKKVPELQLCRESETDFPAAMTAFQRWCAGEREFAVWGTDDFRILELNCEYWALPPLKPKKLLDFQAAFSWLTGAEGMQIALWRAVDYCRIPDIFDFHDALNDALYTALLGRWLTEESLAFKPLRGIERKLARFQGQAFPPQPRRRVGPMPTPEAVLNSKDARTPACPLCGKKVWVQRWQFSAARQYYAPFFCQEHGWFLSRLTLAPAEEGVWKGSLTVPAVTGVLLGEYGRAMQGGVHLCKSTGRKRRRRRKRRRTENTTETPQSG